MLWAVVGNTGLLGSDIEKTLVFSGERVIGFNRSNLNLELSESEIANEIAKQAIQQFGEKPAVAVNAVAYTAVDKAETDLIELEKVNIDYARKLAVAAKQLDSRLIHVSTDFVFDGESSKPYEISDSANPKTAYGISKLAGELAVQHSGADYQIFRTAWLYGENGNCFPKTVSRVLSEKGLMKVVTDQIGQPTWTKDLAELMIAHQNLNEGKRPRLVHATASGSCSWYEFACEIALSLGYNPDQVISPITSEQYPTPATRPAYSVLNNKNETGLAISDWKQRWKAAAGLVLAEELE